MGHCRLAALYAENLGHARNMYTALKLSAENDPYAARLHLRKTFTSHGDGWGYAALTLGEKPSLTLYKTPLPIWRDAEPRLQAPLLAVLHARKASRGTPISLPAAHPYLVSTPDGSLLAVAQNGGLDKAALASLLDEIHAPHPDPEKVSDSHLYAYLLAHLYATVHEPTALLEEAYSLVKRHGIRHSCLNTIVLLLRPDGAAALAASRHVAATTKEHIEYCELYLVESDGLKAVVSSTLALHLGSYNPKRVGVNTVIPVYP